MALGWFSPFISDSRFTILFGKAGLSQKQRHSRHSKISTFATCLCLRFRPLFSALYERLAGTVSAG
jgi:hypothetical protein